MVGAIRYFYPVCVDFPLKMRSSFATLLHTLLEEKLENYASVKDKIKQSDLIKISLGCLKLIDIYA